MVETVQKYFLGRVSLYSNSVIRVELAGLANISANCDRCLFSGADHRNPPLAPTQHHIRTDVVTMPDR